MKNQIWDKDQQYFANVQPVEDAPTGAAVNVKIAGSEANPVTVLGPLTDEELRASAVPVSLDEPIDVTTGGLTDAELRATPVPVSSDALTDTELRATAVNTKLVGDDVHGAGDLTAGMINIPGFGNSQLVSLTQNDHSTHSVNTIDYAHHEIHGGSTYRVQHNNDAIPKNGGMLTIGFYVPDGGTEKYPHMTWDFVHEGNMTMTLKEDPVITLGTGTDRLCRNSRRSLASPDTSFLQGTATGALVSNYVTIDPTYTGGTTISLKRNYGSKNTTGGGNRRNEIILAHGKYYIFELRNNDIASNLGGQIRLEWYEHTDKAPVT